MQLAQTLSYIPTSDEQYSFWKEFYHYFVIDDPGGIAILIVAISTIMSVAMAFDSRRSHTWKGKDGYLHTQSGADLSDWSPIGAFLAIGYVIVIHSWFYYGF